MSNHLLFVLGLGLRIKVWVARRVRVRVVLRVRVRVRAKVRVRVKVRVSLFFHLISFFAMPPLRFPSPFQSATDYVNFQRLHDHLILPFQNVRIKLN